MANGLKKKKQILETWSRTMALGQWLSDVNILKVYFGAQINSTKHFTLNGITLDKMNTILP